MSISWVELGLRLLVGVGLRRQRVIFGVAVGVVAMAIAGAILTLVFARSFEKAIVDRLYSYLGAAWIRTYGGEFESEPSPTSKERLVRLRDYHILPAVHLPMLIEARPGHYEGIELLCVDTNWFQGVWAFRPPTWEGNVLLLSRSLAARLGIKVGDDVVLAWLQEPIRFRRVRLLGTFESGLAEVDQHLGLAPLALGQQLRGWNPDQVQVGHVFLSRETAPAWLYDLQERLTVQDEMVPIESIFSDIFDWLGLIQQNIWLILGIVLAMSFFVLCAAFLVLGLAQRVRFQVLHFLGMSRFRLWRLVVVQALVTVGLGALIGSFVATLLLYTQYAWGWIRLDPESYLLDRVPVIWEIRAYLQVWAMVLSLAVVVGVLVAPLSVEPEGRLTETAL